MEVVEGRSSSIDLSSAPNSDIESPFPVQPTPPTVSTTTPAAGAANISLSRFSEPSGVLSGRIAGAPATLAGFRQDPAPPVKQRKPRKKKDPNTAAATDSDKKEKAPRKPRASAGTAGTSTRKSKVENTDNVDLLRGIDSAAQLQHSKLVQPASFISNSTVGNTAQPQVDAAKTSQNGLLTQPSTMMNYLVLPPKVVAPASPPQVSLPRTGIYDPVRSVFHRDPEPPQTLHPSHFTQPLPGQVSHRASASPAIASIIEPPDNHRQILTPGPPTQPPLNNDSIKPEEPFRLTPAVSSAMDVDIIEVDEGTSMENSHSKRPSNEGSNRPSSPKPQRAKEQPPPPAAGSGLLSSTLFGSSSIIDGNLEASGERPNIVLHVDLKNQKNKVINFARLAEEKYGFAALYPRQAANRERLARVAAAGAALERSASGSKVGGSAGESGDDDGSVDIDHESENDMDVAMSGTNGHEAGNSGTDNAAPARKRRKKVEEYDQDDPFVDDSELLWEAQAAASKDGFFVWCGPLVPEGEKPAVERADGTIKRGRGRGRGGGPGSRGGRGAAAAARAAAAAEGNELPPRGPGSRGGGLTRKPRSTKAEKPQRESEKVKGEKVSSTPTVKPATPSVHEIL